MMIESRRVGAIERMRELHPLDVLLSVVCCALGDEHRSIASARRLLFHLTGYMPEESSFYDRLNPAWSTSPGFCGCER